MAACPSCRREWADGREACGECLATLVEDLDATIDCPECGHAAPARMHSCPGCLALLRPDEVDLTEDVTRLLPRGMRMHRPSDRRAVRLRLGLFPAAPLPAEPARRVRQRPPSWAAADHWLSLQRWQIDH